MPKDNEKLIQALMQTVKLHPEAELGKVLRYVTSVDDLAYMSDADILNLLLDYNKDLNDKDSIFSIRQMQINIKPTDTNEVADWFSRGKEVEAFYKFTKENEQIAYDRYKDYQTGRILINLEERLACSEFVKRFELEFVEPEDFAGWTVINHCTNFLNELPLKYRHMNFYGVARKADKYHAFHSYACKNPCFGELLESATINLSVPAEKKSLEWGMRAEELYDECFVVVIDWDGSPRFTNYTKTIQYGVWTRYAKKEIEIFGVDHTIEIFHELMQKANKILDDWEGVLYDDEIANEDRMPGKLGE